MQLVVASGWHDPKRKPEDVMESELIKERPVAQPKIGRRAPPALEARALTKRFGAASAVESLSLTIEGGEVYCLLGPNGAGKTTTINLFLGFLEPSEGSALVMGLDVGQQPLETKRHLAYIPEQVMLYRNLTGVENLEYFAALAGRERMDRARLFDILVQAGLPVEACDRRVGTYSKGMRQKVGVAIALAKRADALLLDEPTSGLDPKASNEFSELLHTLRGNGVGVLMATHDLFRAKETGTRVGIMRHGRLVAEMSTAELGHADLERVYLEHMRD
jgi:ABC-2 type transport system ATP-binding protein